MKVFLSCPQFFFFLYLRSISFSCHTFWLSIFSVVFLAVFFVVFPPSLQMVEGSLLVCALHLEATTAASIVIIISVLLLHLLADLIQTRRDKLALMHIL